MIGKLQLPTTSDTPKENDVGIVAGFGADWIDAKRDPVTFQLTDTAVYMDFPRLSSSFGTVLANADCIREHELYNHVHQFCAKIELPDFKVPSVIARVSLFTEVFTLQTMKWNEI